MLPSCPRWMASLALASHFTLEKTTTNMAASASETMQQRFRGHWAPIVSDVTPHTQPFVPATATAAADSSWRKPNRPDEPPFDFSTLAEDVQSRTVVITNISSRATNARVLDFMAFAGVVSAFGFGTDADAAEDGTFERHAFVTFAEAEAVTSAVLMSGANIVDRQICVSPFAAVFGDGDEEDAAVFEDSAEAGPGDQVVTIESEPELAALAAAADSGEAAAVSQEKRKKLSILAMLIAAGYAVSKAAVSRAKRVDEGTLNLAPKMGRGWKRAKSSARARGLYKGLKRTIGAVVHHAAAAVSGAAKAAAGAVRGALSHGQ